MATGPAALTGTTGTNEESAAAKMDAEGDSRSAEPQNNGLRTAYVGVLVQESNLLFRITPPPTPDHKQFRPEEQDPPGRPRNVGDARFATGGGL
eukprot:817358-Pyramimonas_sp.AAC.1